MARRDDYSLDIMALSEFFEINKEIGNQTDRGAAIIAGSLVEEHIKWAISRRFVDVSERTNERLFEGAGPLSTFHARSMVGYAIGIYDRTTREELILISRARNRFAHSIKPIDFTDAEIVQICGQLQYPIRYLARFPSDRNSRWKYELSC